MKTGSRGLALIKQFEGLRLRAYQDTVGIWTIGYGHTASAGPPRPKPGLRITMAEADAILARDLAKYEAAVERALRREPSQHHFDAMVSLCFNVGPKNFRGSRLVECFNAGDDEGAAQAFIAWTRAGGAVLPGLKKRRAAEKRLFLNQTRPAKWAVAGTGGGVAGTGFLATFGEAAASSLGYGVADLVSWQFLLGLGVVTGVLAVIGLAAIGHDRRELLWARLFGGWLS
jgi:lysozyme